MASWNSWKGLGKLMEKNRKSSQQDGFHVLCVFEGEHWIAQGIEINLVAFARQEEDLLDAFQLALVSHIETQLTYGEKPFANLGETPEKYKKIFQSLKSVSVKTKRIHIPTPKSDQEPDIPFWIARTPKHNLECIPVRA